MKVWGRWVPREAEAMGKLFEAITVDMTKGTVAYPKLEGFELDMERVYRSAERFAPFCATMEMAVRQAIHEQLSAHQGMMSLPREARP